MSKGYVMHGKYLVYKDNRKFYAYYWGKHFVHTEEGSVRNLFEIAP